jgi:prephenate dehydrogenase
MENSVSITTAIVLGGLGAVGRLFRNLLADAGVLVKTVDQRRHAALLKCDVCADVAHSSSEVLEALVGTDVVIMALPEAVALQAAPWVSQGMQADALLIDTLSIKTEICGLLSPLNNPRERLSLNPMFAPSLGVQGQVIAAVEITAGPLTKELMSLLNRAGATVECISAEMHDKITSATQVATHAAILAFGLTIRELGYDSHTVWKLATPPHRILLALLHRLISGSPEIYWDIQRYHGQSLLVRAKLQAAAASLNETIERDDYVDFKHVLESLRTMLAPLDPDLLKVTERLMQSLNQFASRPIPP